MGTLVICKIAAPALRQKIYARLKNRGICVSQGVFECDFGAAEIAHLQNYLRGLTYGTNDCIILYCICASCQNKRLAFGNGCAGLSVNADWMIL